MCRCLIIILTDRDIEIWKGYFVASVFFMTNLCQSLLYQTGYHESTKLSTRIRASLMDLLYQKALRMRPSLKNGTGNIVNLLGSDLERIQYFIQQFWFLWGTPAIFIVETTILYFQLGWICFIAIGILILLIFSTGFVGNTIRVIQVCFATKNCLLLLSLNKKRKFSLYQMNNHSKWKVYLSGRVIRRMFILGGKRENTWDEEVEESWIKIKKRNREKLKSIGSSRATRGIVDDGVEGI